MLRLLSGLLMPRKSHYHSAELEGDLPFRVRFHPNPEGGNLSPNPGAHTNRKRVVRMAGFGNKLGEGQRTE